MLAARATALSAKQGDACLREIPRPPTKEAPDAEMAHITYGYFPGLLGELASAMPGERDAAIAALGLDRKTQTRRASA